MTKILLLSFLIPAVITILITATICLRGLKKAILWLLSPQQRKLLEQLMVEVSVWQTQTKFYDQERCQIRGDCPIDAEGGTGTTGKLLNAISVQEEKIMALAEQCQQAKISKWRISLII